MSHLRPRLLAVAVALLVAGCSAQRPVLYRNDQYLRAGEAQADAAIEACREEAQSRLDDPGPNGELARNAARDTAVGAAGGAAGGAVWGAIRGGVGSGAAAGAAGGAASGLVVSLINAAITPKPPDPAYRVLVDRCLTDRGFEPIAWR